MQTLFCFETFQDNYETTKRLLRAVQHLGLLEGESSIWCRNERCLWQWHTCVCVQKCEFLHLWQYGIYSHSMYAHGNTACMLSWDSFVWEREITLITTKTTNGPPKHKILLRVSLVASCWKIRQTAGYHTNKMATRSYRSCDLIST
jgi:hypothetical protein